MHIGGELDWWYWISDRNQKLRIFPSPSSYGESQSPLLSHPLSGPSHPFLAEPLLSTTMQLVRKIVDIFQVYTENYEIGVFDMNLHSK